MAGLWALIKCPLGRERQCLCNVLIERAPGTGQQALLRGKLANQWKMELQAEITGLGAHCREAGRKGRQKGQVKRPDSRTQAQVYCIQAAPAIRATLRNQELRDKKGWCVPQVGKRGGKIHGTHIFTQDDLGFLYLNREVK